MSGLKPLAVAAAVIASALPLAACLHYTPPSSPEEARYRMMMLGQAMRNAGAAMQSASPSAPAAALPPMSAPFRTYIVNGRMVTCTTLDTLTTCN